VLGFWYEYSFNHAHSFFGFGGDSVAVRDKSVADSCTIQLERQAI
jgi:hypothetical protein